LYTSFIYLVKNVSYPSTSESKVPSCLQAHAAEEQFDPRLH